MVYEIEELSFSYDSKFTLFVEEFKIDQKIVGVTGSSGAGKSTFLLNLAFLYTGKWRLFKFKGKNVTEKDLAHLRRVVTYVPQHPVLFRKTVFENIAYPLKIRKYAKREIQKKVQAIAQRLRIEDLLDKKSWQLSGGQAKRVCLARGFVFDPEVVLLDEPTSDLDEDSKRLIEEFILQNKSNVVVVSHDKEQLSKLCEKIFFIDNGKLC